MVCVSVTRIVVARAITDVVMSIVRVRQVIVRLAERNAFQRTRRIAGTFGLPKGDVVRRRIVENEVGRAIRRRKPFGRPEPDDLRPIQKLRGTAARFPAQLVFYRTSVRSSHSPCHDSVVITREDKSPIPGKAELWTDLYGDMIFNVAIGVMNIPGVVGPGLARFRAV